MSKVGDQIKFASFKQVPGGYVFRAPNPKVFGRSDHYLVDEAQRDKIVAIMTPPRPRLLLAAWIGGYFLAVAAAIVALSTFARHLPVTVLVVLIAAMLSAAILGLHLAASRNLRRLQPILAGARPTDQRITNAEIRQALNQTLSRRQLLRAGIASAVACVVSAASVIVLIYVRKPGATFFSEPLPLIFCFNAVIFGLSSVYYLRGALKNTEHPEGMGPPANPLFSKISRHLISACAVAFVVFLAAAAGIGIKHEFSDQSQGLRYAGKGEHDKAIASFTKAIAAEPHNSESYLGRANSYSAKGDYDHAIADYGNAIEIEPRDGVVYRKRADAYRLKGALDNAITDYSKTIELDPKDALAYYFRGLSYLANKDSDRAIADFTTAIEIDPKESLRICLACAELRSQG